MNDLPLEKRFDLLCKISRAQHFAWREAVAKLCPDVDTEAVVKEMWRVTGKETAAAYLRHLDPERPLAVQIARSIVWSSRVMGEDAHGEAGESDDTAFVRHDACPWVDWHRAKGLLAEDRPGCDAWFQATAKALGEALSVSVEVETRTALPEGDDCCLRRIRVRRPAAS